MLRLKRAPLPGGPLRLASGCSRRQAGAALAFYSPSRRRGLWLQTACRAVLRSSGPRLLPWRAETWRPPTSSEVWEELTLSWRRAFAGAEPVALLERRDTLPVKLNLVLGGGPAPVFVKLMRETEEALATEARALAALESWRDRTFHVPSLIGDASVGGWRYLATSSLTERIHRPALLGLRELRELVRQIESMPGSPPGPEPREGRRKMHGDLTPWNLRRLADGRLALFDWEEWGWGPPGADEVLYIASVLALDLAPRRHSRVLRAHLGARPEIGDFWSKRVRRWMRGEDQTEADRLLGQELLQALGASSAPLPASGRPRPLEEG